MLNNQIVSICIPVYNGEEYILETLNSILNQTYNNIEIIVSDNCSTDNTVKLVKDMMLKDSRIKLNINNENLGYSGNLNKLISLSKSKYIAIFHADDIYKPTIIEEQIHFLLENKHLAGCFTLGNMINGNGDLIENKFCYTVRNLKNNLNMTLELYIKNLLFFGGSSLICPTSMIKKSVYNELSGYREDLRYIEDQDMWIRILEKYNLGIISKELFSYRLHDKQISGYYLDINRDEISVTFTYIKDYLERNNVLMEKYSVLLNRRLAEDLLSLAKRGIDLKSFEKYKKNVNKSKEYYIFPMRNLKFWLLQNWGGETGFHLNNFLLKIKRLFS